MGHNKPRVLKMQTAKQTRTKAYYNAGAPLPVDTACSFGHRSLPKLRSHYHVYAPPTTALRELSSTGGTSPTPPLSGALTAHLNFHVFPARGCASQTLSTRPNKRLIRSGNGKEGHSPW